jgi:purine-binding chemotaxis protein CheW
MSVVQKDNRYMEFRLGEQVYAVPLLTVKEVIQKPEVTMVPNMPAHFEGMMNLRGQILGVYSIRKKMGVKAKDKADLFEVVVVIEAEGVSVGMIVDEVTRVLHTNEQSIRDAPLKDDDPAKSYVTSVIQSDDQLVLTVNVSKLLELEKYKDKLKTL